MKTNVKDSGKLKVFAIDTSGKWLTIGIYSEGKVYEYSLLTSSLLSTLITVHMKRAMDALKLSWEELDYLACGSGPGSFTGLRIGMAAIKGLAFACGKPLILVPTLGVLAANAIDYIKHRGLECDPLIVPVMDAKRKLVFAAAYKSRSGRPVRVMAEELIDPLELPNKLKALQKGRELIFCGDGCGLYREILLSAGSQATVLDNDYWYPRPGNLINLAVEMLKKGKAGDAALLSPLYLYPKECQIKGAGK